MTQRDESIIVNRKNFLKKFDCFSCNYDNIEATLNNIKLNRKTLLTVTYEDIEFDFLLHIKNTSDKKLILYGNGALPRSCDTDEGYKELLKIPYFSRLTWEDINGCSSIWYADASKKYYIKNGNSVPLGWNIGTKNHWFLMTIKEILVKIMKHYDFSINKTLFYGSSGGGFQSMILSCLMNGKHVMADCPQFDCTLHNCFEQIKTSEKDVEYIINECDYRCNVIKCFNRYNYFPRLLINESFSNGDMNQFNTFLKNLKEEIDKGNTLYNVNNTHVKVNFILENKHTYLTKEDFEKRLKHILR